MDIAQKKKKSRGKHNEPDPDDQGSELSFEDTVSAASKKKGNKKGNKGLTVDDDEFNVSAFDDKGSEPVAILDDNGVASKKKAKNKKKGQLVDDDEYDISAFDDEKSVQSVESSQSREGSKKTKKGKQSMKSRDDDDDDFMVDLDRNAFKNDSVVIVDDEDVLIFSGKKKGKSKLGSKVALDNSVDDAAETDDSRPVHSASQQTNVLEASVLVEEDIVEFTGKKKGKKGKKSDKAAESADIDANLGELEGSKSLKAVPVETDVDPLKLEDGGAATKKKSKKGKKGGRTAQEEEDLDAILAELDGPKPESTSLLQQLQEFPLQTNEDSLQPAAAVTASMPPEGEDGAEGVDTVESAAAKKKKKKKEKEKAKAAGKQLDQADVQAPEEKQEAPKGKVLDKKVPKHVREMQERLARQREAEEKLRREEEERRRKEEEEQRRLEELEREKEEAKRRRKEREKEKLLKKKQEGKLLTGKQKEEARRLALMREQLLAQKGPSTDLDAPSKEDSAPKKPKYDNKKKRRPQGGESAPSTEQPVESFEAPLPHESHMESDVVEMEPEDVVIVEEDQLADAEVEAESDEEEEDWDAKSWDNDDIELPPVRSAFAEEDDEKSASAPKKATKLAITQPSQNVLLGKMPVSAPNSAAQVSKPVTQLSSNGQESEEDSDSEDESEEDSQTKRRREVANRREARKAEALAKRSASDLRSPICCILGHVDTGKTKLLDCIRRTNVQEGEAGGITQQIGATYFPMENILERTKELSDRLMVRVPGLLVIDTPGHESFTNLRSRGSGLCDIAILVVDIMHGLEPQTLESLNLLRMRKTPFIVALNKVDRLYSWKTCPNAPIENAFKQQLKDVLNEFERRLSQIVTQLKEQSLNSELYYKNTNSRKYVNIVPTSAISGEGVPDLLMLLVELSQSKMEEKLMYMSEVQCTVLEVKVIEGLGTTIDVILVNGVLHEGDQIVVCGMQGPIVANIRALLTPHPMKELRVKGTYLHHKELKAAQGIKITAQGLEHAIAGTQLHVVGPDDDLEDIKEEAMQDMKNVMSRVDKSGEGVCVQASTLGSLEALLEFLKSPAVKIPVSGINIGPVHKRDVMRASVMLERKKKEYATILAFDVKVTPEAKELAEDLGVRIFMADIIYHLFDQFTAYMNNIKEEKRKEVADEAVFPCVLSIKPQYVFNKKDPIILGVDVVEGIARVGTPLCVPSQEMIVIGRIASMEVNHKVVETAKKGQAVAMKIVGSTAEETQKMYGRHFSHEDELVSHITRRSIDVLKESFRDELTVDEWKLVVKLKKLFNIP